MSIRTEAAWQDQNSPRVVWPHIQASPLNAVSFWDVLRFRALSCLFCSMLKTAQLIPPSSLKRMFPCIRMPDEQDCVAHRAGSLSVLSRSQEVTFEILRCCNLGFHFSQTSGQNDLASVYKGVPASCKTAMWQHLSSPWSCYFLCCGECCQSMQLLPDLAPALAWIMKPMEASFKS